LLVALLYILIYTNLYAYLDGRSIQYRLNKANQNLSKKWFGIYSRNDEAIAGLRSSLNFQIKNDKKKLPVFSSQADLIPYLRKVLSVILFNSAIRNMYAKIISSKIRKFSLGLDRKFYAVNEVSFKPMDNLHIHEMPKSIDDEIYKEVIEDNISKIDQLRKLLNVKKDNLFDIVMNLEDKNKPLLIHSQYFKNEGVIFAIAEHMTKRIDQHKKKNKYR